MVNTAVPDGFLSRAIDRVLLHCFPATCVLCGGRGDGLDLCAHCCNDFAANAPACPRCGEPLATTHAPDLICGRCLRRPLRYHMAFCPFRYQYPLDHLICALKFNGRLAYARVLGHLFANAFEMRAARRPELLLPVPLSNQRFHERGFNQALEIGRFVEARLRIPLRADYLSRIRHTRAQSGLDHKERRKNLRGAFVVRKQLPAKHIAIFDDVMTTGSTMNEIAATLRRAGARYVEAWAVARTPGR